MNILENNKRLFFFFLFSTFLIFLFPSNIKAVTIGPLDLGGYYQCSRHGSSSNCSDVVWFPIPDRSDYTYGEMGVNFQGHRHGSSNIDATICLLSGGWGPCITMSCAGGTCGPEQGGDHHWFDNAYAFFSSSMSSDRPYRYYIKRYASVDDAEVRMHVYNGIAIYPDDEPPPPDTGAVQVQSNLNTTANITGPSNYSYSGTSQIFNDAPLGTYSISGIANIDCYDYTVLAPGATQTISSNGQTIFFIIDYYEDGSCVEPPPPLPCVDDATITNTTLPSSLNLTSGQVYNFSVTFQNSGTTGWFDGNAYSLRQTTGLSINSTAPACALDLPYGHVCPALNVGGLRTWSFDLTAPTTPGAYSFNERMKHTAGYIYRDSDTNMCASAPGSDIFFGDTLSSTITVSSPFNYSLSNSGNSSVAKSTSDVFVQNSISKTLTAGTGQSVTLSLSPALPAGISYSIANGTCSPNCTSLITFTVTPSAPVGVYPITVIGSPLDKQTSFNLIVSGSPMTVTCSASPSTALIGQTVRWTAVVSGGTPPFSYSWSGTNIPTSPAPNTNPFDIIYGTIGQKSATVTVTDVDSIQAICSVSTVQINFNPKFEEF